MSTGKPYFLTESELDDLVAQRSVVLFGAGYYGEKTLNLMQRPPAFFVDNNQVKQKTEFQGIEVRHPQALDEFVRVHPDAYVVVCVESYHELGEQLGVLGFRYRQNCGISPAQYDQRIVEDLESHDSTVLLSNYETDGGLYLYNFRSNELQQVKHGSIRGFVRVNDAVYCCSTHGLLELDANTFEEHDLLDLSVYELCGITYDEGDNTLVVAASQTDEIIFVDAGAFKITRRLSLSRKYEYFGRECHHVNDVIVDGDFILASMFSLGGWWNRKVYDGGVLEIDKQTWKMRPLETSDFWMPHSLKRHNDRLFILDSMNGHLIRDFKTVIGTFNGFMRGLEIDGKYAYVGQSTHRHVSRMRDHRLNTSIDSGIHILDMENHMSRFVHLSDLHNIYHIMLWDTTQQ